VVVGEVAHCVIAVLEWNTKSYPKVPDLSAKTENIKWYSFLPLGAIVLLSLSQCSESCFHKPLLFLLAGIYCCVC
jgi:hypothetical protein